VILIVPFKLNSNCTKLSLDDEAQQPERTIIQMQFKHDAEVITLGSLRLKQIEQVIMSIQIVVYYNVMTVTDIQIESFAEVRFLSKGKNGAYIMVKNDECSSLPL
jgi:hypothetical protein